MKETKFHPLCHALPVLPNKELAELASDIKLNGQHLPILTLNGEVIDGRNRLLACELAGIEPVIQEVEGKNIPELLGSLNYFRRHLTQSQRAMWLVKVGKFNGQVAHGEPSIAEAAKLTKTSTATIKRAKRVKKSGIKTVQNAVIEGSLSVNEGAKLSKLNKKEKRKAARGGVKSMKEKAASLSPKPKARGGLAADQLSEREDENIKIAEAEKAEREELESSKQSAKPEPSDSKASAIAQDYRDYWKGRTSVYNSQPAPSADEVKMNDKVEKILAKHGV